ncbi:hypothetical protein RYX36_020075, partial [Vicia faba]
GKRKGRVMNISSQYPSPASFSSNRPLPHPTAPSPCHAHNTLLRHNPTFRQFVNPIPLKRPVMTAEPSIIIRELESDDLFLIFASDGLWERLSDEAAVDLVFKYPRAGIAKRLV